ncbi:type II toxin-antitoxin system death-on-curing family toxin [Ferruginibacter sp. SUN106]|uniref:type II toxin-antitoxin system death-on-curing family toxin n=1 Tax=Ferruginibacter sp. SUN106 TaxID=2978348 RepID=UPI003D35C5DC
MISKEEVLIIHNEVVSTHGGANGIREISGLESAISRPFQLFEGVELYTSVFEKAAAIDESIIMNHPFIDGNKRTGYVLMETILRIEGLKINASDEFLYSFIIQITTGEIRFEQIVEWLKQNTSSL